MTLFSLLEDKIGPGVSNTPQEIVIHRGHNPFSNHTGLSNFVMYSTMKNALTVKKKIIMTVMTRSDLIFH